MSQHVTPGDGDDPSLAALVTQWRGQDGSIQPVAVGGHGEGGAAAPLNLDPNAKSGGGSNVSCLAWMCTLCVYKLCYIHGYGSGGHQATLAAFPLVGQPAIMKLPLIHIQLTLIRV